MSDKVRAIIEAATPGPWRIATSKSVKAGDETICRTHDRKWRYGNDEQETNDARFIATFDPEHVALMEAAIAAARKRFKEWTTDTYVELDDAFKALDAYRMGHRHE